MSINPIMLKHIETTVNIEHRPLDSVSHSIYTILQELHSAYSNQLTTSLFSETSCGSDLKLLAPP